jgi:Xaa-Pro aminopeptidase
MASCSAGGARCREREIAALVMQATNDWLGGYVKWFTDLPANNGYPRTVIFHADESMTVIEMGPFDGARDLKGEDPLHRGVGELLHMPSFLSIGYTHAYDADLAVSALNHRGYATVGYVGKCALPHAFVARLDAGLSGTTFVDATEWIDRIKAIKSGEEQGLIRRCAILQDAVLAAVLTDIRPGLRVST